MPEHTVIQPRPASDAEACARFAADLYYCVARRVIEDLGEAGEQAVRRGLREFGLARGGGPCRQRDEVCS